MRCQTKSEKPQKGLKILKNVLLWPVLPFISTFCKRPNLQLGRKFQTLAARDVREMDKPLQRLPHKISKHVPNEQAADVFATEQTPV